MNTWWEGDRVKNTAAQKHGRSQKAQTSAHSVVLLWWKELRYIRTHTKSCLLNFSENTLTGKAPRSCCWRLIIDQAQVKPEFSKYEIDSY